MSFPPRPGNAHRAATIYDVAALAGVSHQTVSRYLRGLHIRPANSDRVEQALAELNYRPNYTARALRSGQAKRIAVMTHFLDSIGPRNVLRGAGEHARAAGYVLDIIDVDFTNSDDVKQALSLITSRDISGLLALSSTDEMQHLFDGLDLQVPVVVDDEDRHDLVGETDALWAGTQHVVDHLANLGHSHLFYVSGPVGWSAARNRLQAYRHSIQAAGLPDPIVAYGDWSAASGAVAVGSFTATACTAVIAANDQMAIGAIRGLYDQGVHVPQHASVVGIDDIPEAAYLVPSLSTLRLDLPSRGRAAARRLIAMIEQTETPTDSAPQPEFIVRGSTALRQER